MSSIRLAALGILLASCASTAATPAITPRQDARGIPSTRTEAVPPTPTAIPRFITGLGFLDISGNLTQRDLATCKEGKGTVSSSLTCSGYTANVLLEVVALGADSTSVFYVQSTVTQSSTASDQIAAQILGFMATMPYAGADPSRARMWVEQNIAVTPAASGKAGATIEIGSARFSITKRSPKEHVLEIASLGS